MREVTLVLPGSAIWGQARRWAEKENREFGRNKKLVFLQVYFI